MDARDTRIRLIIIGLIIVVIIVVYFILSQRTSGTKTASVSPSPSVVSSDLRSTAPVPLGQVNSPSPVASGARPQVVNPSPAPVSARGTNPSPLPVASRPSLASSLPSTGGQIFLFGTFAFSSVVAGWFLRRFPN